MNKQLLILLFTLSILPLAAQWSWHNPLQAGFPVVQNQGFTSEIGGTYTRLPDRTKGVVREPVWNLSRNSAGLAIHLYSDAPQLKIRYAVTGGHAMPHMPATGVSGVDMYRIDSNGRWDICSGSFSFGDTIQYHYAQLEKSSFHDRGFEYRIYLPLYNSVKWLEVGIPEGSELQFIPASTERPIVVYGTSIAQGACASRPAMAWTNIVQRALDYPLINLGFSGNGKLEKEVLELINELPARLFILDCLPNLPDESAEEVTHRLIEAVRQIRSKHTAPILLVEHAGYSNGATNASQLESYTKVNAASHIAFEQLQSEGVKELHYLTHAELNLSPDGWVDTVHPSDLGMQQQATAVERRVRQILAISR